MARALLSKPKTLMAFVSRTFASSPLPSLSRAEAPVLLRRLLPISSTVVPASSGRAALRPFSTRATSSSLNDPNPNWSNRPPKETILLDGCDFEHWLVVVELPDPNWTRDEIIDHYIKTLAQVVGSEEEARMKIYSVSTRHYFAFGALVSEELSYKMKELPGVRWVLPDSYLDVMNKDYGGEPFINGQAVPYDPKYHEEWVRNNARANDRNRRNDRPRNNDRSRNFDRRENTQRRDFQNTSPPPYQPVQSAAPNNMGGGGMQQMPPQNMGGSGGMQQMPPQNNIGGGGMQHMPYQPVQNAAPNNMGGGGMQQMPPQNMGGGGMQQMPPQNNIGGGGMQHMPPQNNMGGGGMLHRPPQSNMGAPPNMPLSNPGGMQQSPPNMGGMPPKQGWSNMPPQQNYNNFSNQMPTPNPQRQNYGGNVPGGNPQYNQN